MKKLIILVIALVAVIAAGSIAYRTLTKNGASDSAGNTEVSAEEAEAASEEGDAAADETGTGSELETEEEAEAYYAPDFTVYDFDGNEVRLSDHLGKPVMINFWASWCGPCKSEMPDLNEVYEEYGDRVDFMVINFTDGERETVESASDYIKEQGYTFPVYYDKDLSAASAYGVMGIPMTVFVDKDGVITDVYSGAVSKENFTESIESVL